MKRILVTCLLIVVLCVGLQIVLPTLAGVIFLVSASFLIYRCRVNVFAKFKVHPFDIDECQNEDMAFDAFVCCADADDNLARDIFERLERRNADGGGYRVCYHERDFRPGAILENVQQAIEHSKRVICVLNKAFLVSRYCMMEFRIAWHWNVVHKRRRLIVVKCSDVDEALNDAAERDVVDDVRLFMSTYTYIEHDSESEDWWQKLLYAMPINRLPGVDEDFHLQRLYGAEDNDDEPLLNAW